MIYRNYIGLDVQQNALRAVVLRRRQRTAAELVAGRFIGVPDRVLAFGQKQPNIRDAAAFTTAVRDLLDPVAGGEDRLALSLPDVCGRLLLLQVEAPLQSRDEGLEIIRWHLREVLPADQAMQIDYQVLSRDEAGRQNVAVAATPRAVVDQYEELLSAAGYGAEQIVFRSLCQYHFFRRRLDTASDFLLVIAEGDTLVFQAYRAGELSYHRARETDLAPETVFRELSRVLAGESARLGALRRDAVYLHADEASAASLLPVLESLFERPVRHLDASLDTILAPGVSIRSEQQQALVAAVGAAEGLM